MTSKGFTDDNNNVETPNDINVSEKPLNPNKITSGRVDINILRSKYFHFYILCFFARCYRSLFVTLNLFANKVK